MSGCVEDSRSQKHHCQNHFLGGGGIAAHSGLGNRAASCVTGLVIWSPVLSIHWSDSRWQCPVSKILWFSVHRILSTSQSLFLLATLFLPLPVLSKLLFSFPVQFICLCLTLSRFSGVAGCRWLLLWGSTCDLLTLLQKTNLPVSLAGSPLKRANGRPYDWPALPACVRGIR